MLSSIICLIVQHVYYSGTLDNVMPWKMWFGFMAVAVVETVTYLTLLYTYGDKRK